MAVRDLDAAVALYGAALGLLVVHRERMEADGVDEVLLGHGGAGTLPGGGEALVQLVSPFRDSSPVARFLERRGEGLHHFGLRVTDCARAIEAARAAGAVPLDQLPRLGSQGTRVAFLHPRSVLGALVELVERPAR